MKNLALMAVLLCMCLTMTGCAKDGDIRMVNGEYRKVFRDQDGQEYFVKDGRKYRVDE